MYSDTLNIAALLEAIGKIEVYSHNSADAHSDIPWQKIKDFRNIIAHDYFGIDADEIWDIVKRKIPQLKSELQRLV